jgi:hypothetical protein
MEFRAQGSQEPLPTDHTALLKTISALVFVVVAVILFAVAAPREFAALKRGVVQGLGRLPGK